MKKKWNILAVSGICLAILGSFPAMADVPAESGVHLIPVSAASRSPYEDIALSQVTDYVNVRREPNTVSDVVGKIYHNCAAAILSEVNGEGGTWYQIQSGTVTGYIKAQYFITGAQAEAKAKDVGTVFATVVNASTLRLREKADLESNSLTLLSEGSHYLVLGEEGEFVKLSIDSDLTGYVHKDYVKLNVEFPTAVSLEEETAKAQEVTRLRTEADDAIRNLQEIQRVEAKAEEPEGAGGGTISSAPPKAAVGEPMAVPESQVAIGPGSGGSSAVVSAGRTAIVAYAKQFLGNPYVYGGTSLTEGADCSGFTQAIYQNFGIAIGRSSRDQALKGTTISVESAQPGDLLFYAGGDTINHVAIYIGGGQVIHSSNPTTGIVISPANYRTPCKAVSVLN